MWIVLAATLFMGEIAVQAEPPQIQLKAGLVITKSVKIKPGIYGLPGRPADNSPAVIKIKGQGITVDFGGAILQGSPQSTDPDKRAGTAIRVEGSGITIRNAKVRGYKIGLIARNVPGLRLVDCDFSYNWKQHLMSTLEREDLSDWMSYHTNEKDEWLRYGCGIYLRGCDGFEVKGTRAVGGQNGLMLTECDNGKVWNCNFSFLSGCGIAMFRSSGNRIMHNKIDWCVRGYSHGVYNRGQDSAGIIIYEQSNKNLFAYNSVTHGGDGFFLWAGQTTMDSGKGGCNDNVLYGNDFSHSPANGIEATFSRNVFANNLLMECWHGIWGGFSWETQVVGNYFGLNGEAIAWEHGQDNEIVENYFSDNNADIALWQNPSIDPNWGYGKNRDCVSRDYEVSANWFVDTFGAVLRLRDTQRANIDDNHFSNANKVFELSGKLPGMTFRKNVVTAPNQDLTSYAVDTGGTKWGQVGFEAPRRLVDGNGTELGIGSMGREEYIQLFRNPWEPTTPSWNVRLAISRVRPWLQKPMQGGLNPYIRWGAIRGRRYILVDEWGPYDLKRPILWPRGEDKDGNLVYEVLGPKGIARPIVLQGVSVQGVSENGTVWNYRRGLLARTSVPGYVRLKLAPFGTANMEVQFEYVGEATTDVRGIVTPKGKPVRFGFHKFHAPFEWDVKWFQYDRIIQEPRSQYESFKALLENGTPVLTEKTKKLDFVDGYKGLRDYYATLAIGTVELPPGQYVLNVTSDDGVRVWVDGKNVIDNWTWHGPTLDTATIAGGKHTIRVEHFEIDGYSCLKVDVQPKR